MSDGMTPLGPASAAVLAFDVGGTDMKAGIVDASGAIRGLRRVATPVGGSRTAVAVLDTLGGIAAELSQEFPDIPLQAAGLTVPGLVDSAAGIGIYSANLPWRDFPFTAEAERRLGLPVAFGHDVASAGSAELLFGAARGFSDVVVMILGTGIAGAVFSGGQPVAAGGYAGELGHALVPDPSGKGTAILESVGSAGAIAQRYAGMTGTAVDGAKAVLELTRSGDVTAQQVWADAIDALAFSIAQCVNIIGTEAVVLGGGLSEAGDELLAPLRRRVDELLTFHRRPRIMPAQLGQNAGLIGAALNARTLLGRPLRPNADVPA
ncbi:ROK family protein [Pseudarthrobacter sp. NBSH8]|uniref:ROK family protein n=1 Tax=Pseudarthrobacter sp. NBSH8 TaxID=2596911 RepID=UPI0021082119|nr:ROK family protein [Pseudarthrobacter sp. NBSH8]